MRRTLLPSLAAAFAASLAAPALAHGALSDRIAVLGDLIAAHPKDAALLLERADLRRQDEAFDGALADLATAETLDADLAPYPVLKAQTLLDAKRPAAAREAVEAFAKTHPRHGAAWWTLGRARLDADDLAGGRAALETALPLMNPLQPDQVLVLARALRQAHRPDDALRRLDAGLAKLGPVPALVEEAVAVELALGRKDAALRRLDALIADFKRRGLKTESLDKRRNELAKTAGTGLTIKP